MKQMNWKTGKVVSINPQTKSGRIEDVDGDESVFHIADFLENFDEYQQATEEELLARVEQVMDQIVHFRQDKEDWGGRRARQIRVLSQED